MGARKRSLQSLLNEHFVVPNVEVAIAIGRETVIVYGVTSQRYIVTQTEKFKLLSSGLTLQFSDWPEHEHLSDNAKRLYSAAQFGVKSGIGFSIVVIDTELNILAL